MENRIPNNPHKLLPEPVQLPLSYPTDAAHLRVGDRLFGHHLIEGDIVKNQVGRDAELASQLLAQYAQLFK